ncbi:MAG: hypothetical protein FWE14_00025 [Lachnospiraceae bacterium]|nr:hypothetical protein [Lachnospiraceae bacterium]
MEVIKRFVTVEVCMEDLEKIRLLKETNRKLLHECSLEMFGESKVNPETEWTYESIMSRALGEYEASLIVDNDRMFNILKSLKEESLTA